MTMFETVGKWIIPIVILILLAVFYYGGGGAFDKLKKIVPNISIGMQELQAETPSIPENQKTAFLNLATTIEKIKNNQNYPCFERYSLGDYDNSGGLPDLGEEGTIIEFRKDSFVVKTQGGKQDVTELTNSLSEKVHDVEFCVIAGPLDIVPHFAESFLNDQQWAEKKIMLDHYYQVQHEIIIKYENPFGPIAEGNVIRIPEIGSEFGGINSLNNNFKDFGYLYKPDATHICFFPTVYGDTHCDGSDQNGLDDDCLGADPYEDIAIPKQVSSGLLRSCSGPEPLTPPSLKPVEESPTAFPDETLPGGVAQP